MRTKYSRFLTADSQGMYAVSLRRKRVELRARATSTSLALRKAEFGFGEIRVANEPATSVTSRFRCDTLRLQSHDTLNLRETDLWPSGSTESESLPRQVERVVNKLASVHQWDPLKTRARWDRWHFSLQRSCTSFYQQQNQHESLKPKNYLMIIILSLYSFKVRYKPNGVSNWLFLWV